MIEERSAGVIIYVHGLEDIFFLLLNYPSKHWDFVKGKIEKGETYQQTAIRETKEETDIMDLKFSDEFKEYIEYRFRFEKRNVHKKVIFFLAETNTMKVSISNEHTDYTWLDYNDALKKITYRNSRSVLSKAARLLNL